MNVPSISKADLQALIDANAKKLAQGNAPQTQDLQIPSVGFEDIHAQDGVEKVPHPMIPAVASDARMANSIMTNSGDSGNSSTTVIPQVSTTSNVATPYTIPAIAPNSVLNTAGSRDNTYIDPTRGVQDAQDSVINNVSIPRVGDINPNDSISPPFIAEDSSTAPDKLTQTDLLAKQRDSAIQQIIKLRGMTGKDFKGGKTGHWYINALKGALDAGAKVAADPNATSGNIVAGLAAGAGASLASPNYVNRIDRDQAIAKQGQTVQMLNQQIGDQLKEQSQQALIGNYGSLDRDRVAKNATAQTNAAAKDKQQTNANILNNIRQVYNNAVTFDPVGNIQDQALSNKFKDLTGVGLSPVNKGMKGAIKSDAKTGEVSVVTYNPNVAGSETVTHLKNPDGTAFIAFDPATVAAEAAGTRQDKDLQWRTNHDIYQRQTDLALANIRKDIELQLHDKTKTDNLIQQVTTKAMDSQAYQVARIRGHDDEAAQILQTEVETAVKIANSVHRTP